ncbi:MAG: hypothetical protein GX897_08750 [Clostridiales bacterium]|nr:hypothetical protein [Clostridiales bacterium]
MPFLCGASRKIITPPLGTPLFGYRPDVFSTTVHDDLTATAVAFGNDEKTALLISLAVGELSNEVFVSLRKKVAEASGVNERDIIIHATHTHSAPNVCGMEGWGEVNHEYIDEILSPMTIVAAKEAVDSMKPAELGVEEIKSEIGINRRQQDRHGNILLGQNPWGCYDPYLTFISVRNTEDRSGIINLIHYGCHGTACGCSTEITRDWSGVMIDRVEKQTGIMTAFLNGAIGDVGPRLSNGQTVGDITFVRELGSYAAMDAMRVFKKIRSYSSPKIKIYNDTIRLPYNKMPELAEVEKKLQSYSEPEKLVNLHRLTYMHLKEIAEYLKSDPKEAVPEFFAFEENILKVGDILFIPYPYEFFSEISMRLRAYTGVRHTLALSCSNGCNAYLPVESALCRGGYETAVFQNSGLFTLTDNADQHLINETLRIIEEGDNK